eukprot:9745398-Lingulodinium_polyedra.AAC.1
MGQASLASSTAPEDTQQEPDSAAQLPSATAEPEHHDVHSSASEAAATPSGEMTFGTVDQP